MAKLRKTLWLLCILLFLHYSSVNGNCIGNKRSLNVALVYDSFDLASVTSFERAIKRHNSAQAKECGLSLTHTTLPVSQDANLEEGIEEANKALGPESCLVIYAAEDVKGKIFLEMGISMELVVLTTIQEFYYSPKSDKIYYNYDPADVFAVNKVRSTETKIEALLDLLQELRWRKFVVITDDEFESLRFLSLLKQTLSMRNLEILDWLLFTRDTTEDDTRIRFQNLSRDAVRFIAVSNDNSLLNLTFNAVHGEGQWVILSDIDVMYFSSFPFPPDTLLMTPRTNQEATMSNFVDDAMQSISLSLAEASTTSNVGCPGRNEMRRRLSQAQYHRETGPVKFDERGNRLTHCYDVNRMLYGKEADPMGYWCDGKLHVTKQGFMREFKILLNEYPPNVLSQPKIPGETCQSNSMPCIKIVDGKEIELCCYGFAVDVIEQVAQQYPFIPKLLFSLDGQYGVYDEKNDSWNGVVAELLNNRGDASLDLYISSRRANVVDFAGPYMPSGIRLLVKEGKRQDNQIYWLSYLRPFTPPVWLTLLGSLGVMICFLWAMDKISPVRGSKKIFHSKTSFGFDNAICFALALAFGRPADESKPSTNGARLSSVAFGMAMLVFVSTYSANLAAFLIVDDKATPVEDIYDLKIERPPDGFKYGTIEGSYMADYFKNSENAYFRHIWYHMKNNNVKSLSEGVHAVRSGKLDVFIADDVGLEYESMNDPYCELKVIGEPFAMSGASLAVKKGNPIFVPLSDALRKIQAKGLTDYIQQFWVKKFSCKRDIPPGQLKVEDLSGLFLQLTIAMIACVLGTLCHRTYASVKEHYRRRRDEEFDEQDLRYRLSHTETLV